jgi:isopenicillin-N epimerase
MSAGESVGGRALPRPSALAAHWDLDPSVVFLNHGSFGACPLAVLDRQDRYRRRMEREPIRFFVEDLEGLMDGARHALASFVGADPEGIAWVPNATAGVNTVLRSLAFEPGDELLTNSHEYNACNNVLRMIADRSGAKVVSVDVPWPITGDDQAVAAVLAGVTPRTRLCLLSHVTSPSGIVFPAARIVAELSRRGVDTLVDGAHAPGMLPLDLAAINPAYYTGNLHKWLCTPKGSAFLHVRADRREAIRPLIVSHGANSARMDRPRFRLEFDYCGTSDASPWLCVPDAISVIGSMDPRGWAGVMERNRALCLESRRLLCRELGVEPPAPESMLGTLAAVPINPRRPGDETLPTKYHDAMQDRLLARWGIQVPVVVFPDAKRRLVRTSSQLYNTIEQVAYLVKALKAELGR